MKQLTDNEKTLFDELKMVCQDIRYVLDNEHNIHISTKTMLKKIVDRQILREAEQRAYEKLKGLKK